MNRQTLSDATSLHDGAVPIYAMQEIANGTKASEREAEKTADFLLGRLSKTNLIVKLKALQIISFCIREGAPVFADIIREEQEEIRRYSDFSGPPDPVMGDERYRRIRVASQEVLVCLNDGNLPRRNDPPPQANSNTWGPPQGGQQPHGYGAPYSDNPNQSYGQSGGYGGAPPSNQPWGKPSSDSRPAPYSDHPSNAGPSYGGSQGYGGQSQQQNQNYGGGPGGYGQSQGNEHHNPGYGGGNGGNAYGNIQPHHQPQHQPHQPSGLSSWSSPAPSGPSYGAPKPAGSGMWSSSGYQKSAPPPSYGGGPSYSRDNRPTVLVGHSLNFPKPTSHGNSSLIGGVSGTSSTAYGGTPGFGGSSYGNSGSGFSGGSSGGFGSQSGGYGGNSNSNMGAGFGGATNRPTSFADQNLNRMLSAPGSLGFNGLHGDSATATKLGKAVEGLKKIGVEAKGRWDRRNMDKSIGASLADHDELTAGPAVMDRGYYQPSMQQGTGGRDTSGEYERGMIDNLCASVGLARAPPADALKRFVDLAQTLDAQTIGDILLDKLEDSVWQVRLKALHVVLALLESPGSAPYMEFFEENAGVFEELAGDAKPTVASKSTQVLRGLGMVDDSTPVSTAPKRPTARATAPAARAAHPPAGDVDFLGFEGLTIQQSQHQAAPPNIYGSPPPAPAAFAHQQAPPQPQVSLLDGFDSAPAPNYQQQHFQHQTLSPRQQAPPPQQPEYADLLPMSPPQQPHQAPSGQVPGINLGGDDRSKTLGNFGKDLFTIANSPRGTQQPGGDAGAGERSAFNFM